MSTDDGEYLPGNGDAFEFGAVLSAPTQGVIQLRCSSRKARVAPTNSGELKTL
jgi:hypothetical protein